MIEMVEESHVKNDYYHNNKKNNKIFVRNFYYFDFVETNIQVD